MFSLWYDQARDRTHDFPHQCLSLYSVTSRGLHANVSLLETQLVLAQSVWEDPTYLLYLTHGFVYSGITITRSRKETHKLFRVIDVFE